jgi:hypothetical protein
MNYRDRLTTEAGFGAPPSDESLGNMVFDLMIERASFRE